MRSLFRAWPALVWCGALAGAAWIYADQHDRGGALAHEEILLVSASPSVAGRLTTLSVQLGAEVLAGDRIATLDTSEIDAKLRFARARFERSRTRISAERDELELDARDRRAQAAARRLSYEAEGRRIRGAIDRFVAAENADRVEVAGLEPQIERLRPLAENNTITLDRLEALEQSRAVLLARIRSGSESIRRSREELEQWEKSVPAVVVETDVQARLVPYELELQAQEARVEELVMERGMYNISAPAAGVVSEVLARPGEWREEGEPILMLVVRVPDRVTAYVTGKYARDVELGATATLHPRDRPGPRLEGRVLGVGPRMELIPLQLRAYPNVPEWGRRVSISMENPESPLPGEVYTVRFQ